MTDSPFVINSDGSLLTSSVTLDYESLSYYEVIVAATDSGIPAQTVSELLNDLETVVQLINVHHIHSQIW